MTERFYMAYETIELQGVLQLQSQSKSETISVNYVVALFATKEEMVRVFGENVNYTTVEVQAKPKN